MGSGKGQPLKVASENDDDDDSEVVVVVEDEVVDKVVAVVDSWWWWFATVKPEPAKVTHALARSRDDDDADDDDENDKVLLLLLPPIAFPPPVVVALPPPLSLSPFSFPRTKQGHKRWVAVISFAVKVPVLSTQMVVAQPRASTAGSFLTMAFLLAMRITFNVEMEEGKKVWERGQKI
jgi:hypothetical protein